MYFGMCILHIMPFMMILAPLGQIVWTLARLQTTKVISKYKNCTSGATYGANTKCTLHGIIICIIVRVTCFLLTKKKTFKT